MILWAHSSDFQVSGYKLALIDDYLKDRTLLAATFQGTLEFLITAGVSQGAVLGPNLWDARYDDLLRLLMPIGVHLTGFANDIAVTVLLDSPDAARQLISEALRISRWLKDRYLQLAIQKTEMVVMTRQRWFELPFTIQVDNIGITSVKSARYVGVHLDEKLTFWKHITAACEKASSAVAGLSRILLNTAGPRSSKRKVLLGVIHSILLYGAEIWADSFSIKKNCRKLGAVQRRGALRVTCAYRIVSEAAVLVIAGAPE